MWRAGRDWRKMQPLQIGRGTGFISKGTYKGCLGRPQDKWISSPTHHIFQVHIEAFTGYSHVPGPVGLIATSLSQVCDPGYVLLGKASRVYTPRTGEAAGTLQWPGSSSWGKRAVTASWWPNTGHYNIVYKWWLQTFQTYSEEKLYKSSLIIISVVHSLTHLQLAYILLFITDQNI